MLAVFQNVANQPYSRNKCWKHIFLKTIDMLLPFLTLEL